MNEQIAHLANTEGTTMQESAHKINFAFDVGVPRHYYQGSIFLTHLLNGLNLINPLGERFFIRSVCHFSKQVEGNDKLGEEIKKFCAQEVKHGYEHEQFCKVLEVHGYSIQPFLSLYNRIAFGFLEKLMSPALCLSITVALEHVTAVLSERALASNFLDQAHPMMRDLFRWHAAEEIEHKNVAFDVLKTVNDSYILRIAGMMMGLCLFFIIWFWAIFTLFFQETEIAPSRMLIDILSGIRVGLIGRGEIACAMLQYMHPGFHPNDIDNATLAEDFWKDVSATL